MAHKGLFSIIVIVAMAISSFFTMQYTKYEENKKNSIISEEKKEEQRKEDNKIFYDNGIKYLQNGRFTEARTDLENVRLTIYDKDEKYKDLNILINYSNIEIEKEKFYVKMQERLKDIPAEYKGQFSTEINSLREKVKTFNNNSK